MHFYILESETNLIRGLAKPEAFSPFCSSGILDGEGLYLCFCVIDWISKMGKGKREFRGTVAAAVA